MKSAVIVDIDGTLADVEHRRHFVSGDKKDFDAFYEAMGEDTPVTPVIQLVRMYRRDGYSILLCTGRPERYRGVTEKWLISAGVNFDWLHMRPKDQEYTPDHQIKLAMLERLRTDGYDPQVAIDDRDQVVQMWREEGLVALQCAEGEF